MAEAEFTGKNVNYYLVKVDDPKRLPPYEAECEDIIEALGMTFAEGCAFKALWRSAAERTLGLKKKGSDGYGIYDAEKVEYYGGRMIAQRTRAKRRAEKTSVQGNIKIRLDFPPIVALCSHVFKSPECGYTGTEQMCSKSRLCCSHFGCEKNYNG